MTEYTAPSEVTIPVTFRLESPNILVGFHELWAELKVSDKDGTSATWPILHGLPFSLILQTTLPHPDGPAFMGGAVYSANMLQAAEALAKHLLGQLAAPGEAGEHVHPEPEEAADV